MKEKENSEVSGVPDRREGLVSTSCSSGSSIAATRIARHRRRRGARSALGRARRAAPAFARRTGSTTKITMWANHPEWKPVLDALIKDFQNPPIRRSQVEIDYKPERRLWRPAEHRARGWGGA